RTFDHLLNLSRVGAETAGPDLRPADLHETAAAVFAEVRAANPTAAFEITRVGEFGGVFDAGMLREVIANVVATVLPYAGNDAPIAVHFDGSHRDRLWLRVSVRAVIPADVQERMFVPGPNVAGLEASGIGLGLQPIDGYVRAHGGSVVGRSRAPTGTVFEMLLPRDALGRE
ncbi:MAG: ATP-binding protein, partial [Caldimonas sp.]